MPEKKQLTVRAGGRVVRVGWYPPTGTEVLEATVRRALDLPSSAPLTLVDADGDVLALSDALPTGLEVTLGTATAPAPVPVPVPVRASVPAAAPVTMIQTPRGPRPYPLVGNVPDLTSGGGGVHALTRLTREYGSFIRFKVPGMYLFVTSDADVVQDLVARPTVFKKVIPDGGKAPLANLRRYSVGSALFTANDDEELWHVAHRVLSPALGTLALKQYYPRIVEVCDQLLTRLERVPPGESVLATDVMTRMTFEAISYSGFDTRFNCLDATETPTFVQAMTDVLDDAMASSGQLLPEFFHPIARSRRERADAVLRDTVDAIIKHRREALQRGDRVPNDILQIMLTSRDKVTGKVLPDENIRHQLITFLVAGHETTSGLLSYALYHLATEPDVERRLQEEADRVLGGDFSYRPGIPEVEQLDYTLRVLKEALRLNPTAPAFMKMAMEDTVLAGKYAVPRGSTVLTFLPGLHTNPDHWGPDATRFDPDRFLPERVAARHPNAYHPFGVGMRSCIGFQFALLEARMVLARLAQRFTVRLADPQYVLRHHQTLTIKPENLRMVFQRREEHRDRAPITVHAPVDTAVPVASNGPPGSPVWLLYGSNMGASQDVAQTLARQLRSRGFAPVVGELDAWVGRLPTDGPVLIVTSTYNGQPPDNAVKFAGWLASPGDLHGVRYAVLGCGNKQWRTTFQAFPRRVDEALAAAGAERLVDSGVCDADGDFDAAAEAWCQRATGELTRRFATTPEGGRTDALPVDEDARYAVELVNFAGAQEQCLPVGSAPAFAEARTVAVVRNDELQGTGSERSTRHIEVALPEGVTYAAGDHLGVFPENPPDVVDAVAQRCGVRVTDVVLLRGSDDHGTEDGLPCGVPLRVHDLLTYQIDLVGPITRRELRALARRCPCPPERLALERLATEEVFQREVLDVRRTLPDLLAQYQSVTADLGLLLSLRPQLKPRYYSIASSPAVQPGQCTVTVGVHTHAGTDGALHDGVCSHYLARCPAGTSVRVFVKDTRSTFRLPADSSRDVVLIGPGTGVAPMRGFVQERGAQRRAGQKVGATLLFFGCRNPAQDWLYRTEFERAVADGTLDGYFSAFSRDPGCERQYVQHLLRAEGERVYQCLARGGSVYVCGDARKMAPDVRTTLVELFTRHGGFTPDEALARVEALTAEGRYLQDVWAS